MSNVISMSLSWLVWFIAVCFKVFDKDKDGLLNRTELEDMVESMLIVREQNTPPHLLVRSICVPKATARKGVSHTQHGHEAIVSSFRVETAWRS